jgi:hypothetical protein
MKALNRCALVVTICFFLYVNSQASSNNSTSLIWFTHTVEQGNVGAWSALALFNNRPHIAYTDDALNALKYAFQDILGWDIEIVDNSGYVGLLPSIAIDSKGDPHIAYYSSTGFLLKYAYKEGGNWVIEPLASAMSAYRFASLVLDNNDYPHIAYVSDNWHLLYTYRHGTGWNTETIEANSSSSVSLALYSNGQPHVSYVSGNSVRYAYLDAVTGWQTQILPTTFSSGFESTSLALDSEGMPHIIYASIENEVDSTIYRVLRYAHLNEGQWQIQLVDGVLGVAGDVGGYNALALDRSDYPRVSYFAGGAGGGLKYAFYDGSDWQFQIVDTDGFYTSLALDEFDNNYISYRQFGQLKLARSTPDYPEKVYLPMIGVAN